MRVQSYALKLYESILVKDSALNHLLGKVHEGKQHWMPCIALFHYLDMHYKST